MIQFTRLLTLLQETKLRTSLLQSISTAHNLRAEGNSPSEEARNQLVARLLASYQKSQENGAQE
jgi:hypothetical protein